MPYPLPRRTALLGAALALTFPFGSRANGAPARRSISLPFIENSSHLRRACDALSLAYRALDVDVRYVDMPALRSLVDSNAGILDGEVGRTTKIEATYPNLHRINVPLSFYSISTIVLKKNGPAPDLQQAPQVESMGVIRGLKALENISQNWRNVTTLNNEISAIQMLQYGHIASWLHGTIEARDAMSGRHMNSEDFDFREVASFPLFHYLHTSRMDLAPGITAELLRIKGKKRSVLDALPNTAANR